MVKKLAQKSKNAKKNVLLGRHQSLDDVIYH